MRKFLIIPLLLFLTVGIYAQEGAAATARLRPINYTEQTLSVQVDGESIFFSTGEFSAGRTGFLDAGTYELTIISADFDEPLLDPVEIAVEAGDLWELMVYELDGELTFTPVELNELAGKTLDLETESPWVYLNLLTDTEGINIYYDDQLAVEDLGYGEFGLGYAPLVVFDIRVETNEGQVIRDASGGFGEPYYSLMQVYSGEVEGENFFVDSYDLVNADLITYLEAYNRYDFPRTYRVFLNAVYVAGVEEEIATAGDVFYFVPSDEAFGSLPRTEVEGLMNDPDQLATLILSHIVPVGQFPPNISEPFTMETLAGTLVTAQAREDGFYVGDALFFSSIDLGIPEGFGSFSVMEGVITPGAAPNI